MPSARTGSKLVADLDEFYFAVATLRPEDSQTFGRQVGEHHRGVIRPLAFIDGLVPDIGLTKKSIKVGAPRIWRDGA